MSLPRTEAHEEGFSLTLPFWRKRLFPVLTLHAAAAKSLQSCPTLCDPIDGSPPGSAIPGILQARTLEWVAISFSKAWKWKVKVKLLRVRHDWATELTDWWTLPHSSFILYNCGINVPLIVSKINVPYVILQRRQWHPTLVLLPGKSHGQRSLVGCSQWGH